MHSCVCESFPHWLHFTPAAADRYIGCGCVHSSSGVPAVRLQSWSHQCTTEGRLHFNTDFAPLLGHLIASAYWYLHANQPAQISIDLSYIAQMAIGCSKFTLFCSAGDNIILLIIIIWETMEQTNLSQCLETVFSPNLFQIVLCRHSLFHLKLSTLLVCNV